MLDHCTQNGIGFIPWAPIAAGELAAPGGPVHEAATRLGATPGQVALAWLLHQEGVTGPIIGPRTQDQLDDAQHAITVHLGEDVLKRLDDIFPGYQPAPEHYAW